METYSFQTPFGVDFMAQMNIDRFKDKVPEILKDKAESLFVMNYFRAPASVNHHGNHLGGLFEHSMCVAVELQNLTDKLNLKWQREESPWIVGLLHDLCKCDLYRYEPDKNGYVYTNDSVLSGHGDKSVILAQRIMQLTDEEIACVRWHMGAFEKDTSMWQYYNNAIKKYPNVLYTHTADMIASQIVGK